MTPATAGPALIGRPGFDPGQVPQYYTRKTSDILHKYGPGPRTHFHVGMFGPGEHPQTTVAQRVLKRRIVDSQEAVLARAAQLWDVAAAPPETLLDVGCGLGGGSLFWAQEYGARVTGLTVTPDHIPVIEDFTRRAGAQGQVTAVLGDVHDWERDREYDAAVAIESSGYMDRERLFTVMARTLRPGGWFGIQEHFLCRPEWTEFVDGYYRTRLGTLTEYIRAARAAGFELELDEDITDRVSEFWVQSMAWTTAEIEGIDEGRGSPIARDRLVESALTHGKFYRVWRDHALETRLLLFRLAGGPTASPAPPCGAPEHTGAPVPERAQAPAPGRAKAPAPAPAPAPSPEAAPRTGAVTAQRFGRTAADAARRGTSGPRSALGESLPPFYCPLPDAGAHPDAEALGAHALAWADHYDLYPNATERAWAQAIHNPDFVCRAIPHGDTETLLLFMEWNYWAWAVDDWQDSGSAAGRTAVVVDHGQRVLRALEAPGSGLLPAGALSAALDDLVTRTRARFTPARLHRLTTGTRDWLAGVAGQTANTERGRMPSLNDYVAQRVSVNGTRFSLAFSEAANGIELPPDLHFSPPVQALTDAAGFIVSCDNDLFSYAMDDHLTPPAQNLVNVLAHQRGRTPREVLPEAVVLRDRAMTYFTTRAERLTAGHGHPELPRYVQALETYVAGCMRWMSNAPRYASPRNRHPMPVEGASYGITVTDRPAPGGEQDGPVPGVPALDWWWGQE
ncbi:terpene synthase family protein [Streptomyces cremeus]|uniref:Methyltransferase domain-containing protein n=1 Tax=Streptomyces cremeus TaxID=66881 RepID=A0ABV5PBQ6_STRCM